MVIFCIEFSCFNTSGNFRLGNKVKIIDPDSKQDVGDEIVGHVFVIIAIVLIYRLSYTIYI